MTRWRAVRLAGGLLLFLICISCGETYRPVANPVLPNQPNPVFAHLAVVLNDNGANNPGSSTTIDVSGDTAGSQSTVGLTPVHGAIFGSGNFAKVYVANRSDDTVSVFSPSQATPVTTISLPTGSTPAFVTTTELTTVYVANPGNNTVSAISASFNAVTNTIAVGAEPVALAELLNQRKLYVANQGTGGAGGSVMSINTIDKSVNPPIVHAWVSPVWVLARSDSQRVYVLDQGAGEVAAIDTASDAVVGSVSVGAGADYMTYDGKRNRLYVINPVAGTLTSLEASTDALTPSTRAVANPVSVAVLPDGTRVYVSSATMSGGTVTSRVTIFNAVGLTVRTTIPLASVPAVCATTNWSELSLAAAVDGSRIYVGNCDAGSTAIIQTTDDTLVLQMPAPISSLQPSQIHVTAATQNGGSTVYAYSLVSGPALRVGLRVAINGMDDSGNNGVFPITALTAGTLTVTNPSGVTASSQSAEGTAVTPQNPVFVLGGT